MTMMRFLAADTRHPSRRRIADAYRELEIVKQERDILKKAILVFSRHQL